MYPEPFRRLLCRVWFGHRPSSSITVLPQEKPSDLPTSVMELCFLVRLKASQIPRPLSNANSWRAPCSIQEGQGQVRWYAGLYRLCDMTDEKIDINPGSLVWVIVVCRRSWLAGTWPAAVGRRDGLSAGFNSNRPTGLRKSQRSRVGGAAVSNHLSGLPGNRLRVEWQSQHLYRRDHQPGLRRCHNFARELLSSHGRSTGRRHP